MTGALEQLPEWARELLERGRIAHLGLVDDRDRPRVLPVTYALVGGRAYSAIDEKPKRRRGKEVARVRYLRRRPEAALSVDHYADDWRELAWVQLLGRVEIVDAADDRRGLDALTSKYAPYRAGPPGGPLLRLDPDRALCWRAAE